MLILFIYNILKYKMMQSVQVTTTASIVVSLDMHDLCNID